MLFKQTIIFIKHVIYFYLIVKFLTQRYVPKLKEGRIAVNMQRIINKFGSCSSIMHKRCRNTELFLVCIFLYYPIFRIISFPVLSVLSEYRKIQARKNSVFKHFSRSSGNFENYYQQQKMKECMDSFVFK